MNNVNNLLFFLICLNLIISIVNLFIRVKKNKVQKVSEIPDPSNIPPDEVDEQYNPVDLSPREIERLESEKAFDSRIKRFQQELSIEHAFQKRQGIPAEELHPGVHNLPHNVIHDYSSDGVLEVAE